MTRRLLYIFCFFSAIVFVSCKKDKGEYPSIINTPTPFVEYRGSFIGNYNGTLTHTSYYTEPPITATQHNYTTTTTNNVLNTISKSTTEDSVLISGNPLCEFPIRANGLYDINNQTEVLNNRTGTSSYHIKFINDSVYIYFSRAALTMPHITGYNIYKFSGKKQ
jgi:hypothetical protein